jgi:hypothetical protein
LQKSNREKKKLIVDDLSGEVERRKAQGVPSWTMAPVVAAYQAMPGVSFLVAVT